MEFEGKRYGGTYGVASSKGRMLLGKKAFCLSIYTVAFCFVS